MFKSVFLCREFHLLQVCNRAMIVENKLKVKGKKKNKLLHKKTEQKESQKLPCCIRGGTLVSVL